jgi:hypothetical protein
MALHKPTSSENTMKRTFKILIALPLLMAMSIAHAQKMYMCKDASGRTITSDRPIPECADRATKELDRTGMVRREIPPPPTPEQRREQKMKEEKAKADAIIAEEQKQNDRLILAHYANEKDIEASRKRALDLVQERIKRETNDMTALQKNLTAVQAEAAAQTKAKGAPSPVLKHRMDEAEQAIETAKKSLQVREAELVQINTKHDQTLKRFREITGEASAK